MRAVVEATHREPAGRADEFATRAEIWRFFVTRGSARVLAAVAALLLAARLVVGGFGRGDVIALAVTLAITGTVEWIIHRHLLHAPLDSWASRTLGTGTGHHQHHLDPPAVEWLLLRPVDAGVFVVAFGAVTAAWALPLMWITGSSPVGGFLTAWFLAAVGLVHYEFVHLMEHSRYRPRSRYYAGLTRRHRLHHYRNERYWLGITSATGDRILRTDPARGDVPASDTARALDR